MAEFAGERLTRDRLVESFLQGGARRADWRIGMELEKMGRRADNGRPLPYDGEGPVVRAVLEHLLGARGGEPMLEEGRLIGIDAPWGTITLEPGGQVEWSSRPRSTLSELEDDLERHVGALANAATALGIRWLDVAVDPDLPVADMPWMPKKRYEIMREYFRQRGRLAHRMMTQTASIQSAVDYADDADWTRKFRAAAALAPIATALFANSERMDGVFTGHRSYRHPIWRETDDDRCGLPPAVFEDGFGAERWIDWILDVPMLFRRVEGGLAPPDGSSFRQRLESDHGRALEMADWVTHCSSIFTEVRSYRYIEVRSADLQPGPLAFAVPTFWAATLYDDDALAAALEIGAGLDHAGWLAAMDSAARLGLDGLIAGHSLREAASRCVTAALRALRAGAHWAGDGAATVYLERLASHLGLDLRA